MTNVSPATEKAADLLQKLTLDSQANVLEVPEVTNNGNAKKPSANKYGSINGSEVQSGPNPSSQRSTTPTIPDFINPSLSYLSGGYPSSTYLYGGYDGHTHMNEWDEYSRYMSSDGGVYGDGGPLMYNGYGYAPYGAYPPAGSPVPTMGHDGQLYGPQQYQYAAPYYQPSMPSDATHTSSPVTVPQVEVSTSVAADQAPVAVKKANGNAKGDENMNTKGSLPSWVNYSNSLQASNGSYGRGVLQGGVPASAYQDLRFQYGGIRSPTPTTAATTPRNQNNYPLPHLMGLHPGPASGMGPAPAYMNRLYPNRMYDQYGNMVRSGPGFGSNGFDSRANGRGWLHVDSKYKPRGRGSGLFYGNETADGLNELNRGPRAGRFKPQKGLASNISPDSNTDEPGVVPDRDQYNKAEFPSKYSDAKFFVIKSYSEDDIHRSVKYNVWASTPNGNKKLDAAYQEAHQKSDACPVFLFFSVNTSGQFVGVAEMVGPVDFNKNLEYWQQDKWNGCFRVKWHIVKDVPNNLLKHITLENNDNKPVTNSRDTQEVKLEQGLEMLKIFKDYVSKTNILDDFGFYESRQKAMQERKAKSQPFQKQVSSEEKPNDASAASNEKEKDTSSYKVKLQKPIEVTSVPNKEAGLSEENNDTVSTTTGNSP